MNLDTIEINNLTLIQITLIALAILIYGFSKGGGGALSTAAVPIMSLAIPPSRAAAIMLPLLITLDVLTLLSFRGTFDRKQLRLLFPPAIVGMTIAAFVRSYLSDNGLRILVGIICFFFIILKMKPVINSLNIVQNISTNNSTNQRVISVLPIPSPNNIARFWGSLAGFTSTLIHAGSPPIMIHLMSLQLEPRLLAGTQAWFLASLNLAKVTPFILSNQLDLSVLKVSLFFMPITPIGIWLGQRFLKKLSPNTIYNVFAFSIGLSGILMLWRGFTG